MLDIDAWMDQYRQAVLDAFDARVRFIGLQGSRGRGEATERSDIDAVLVLDQVQVEDLDRYRALLDGLPHRELACGFVSGQPELAAWDPADRYMLYRDTLPVYGDLQDLVPPPTREEAAAAALTGACLIHHMLTHNYLHARSERALRGAFKTAAFVLRAKVEAEQGVYARTLKELEKRTDGLDAQVLRHRDEVADLQKGTELLLAWTRGIILMFGNSSSQ